MGIGGWAVRIGRLPQCGLGRDRRVCGVGVAAWPGAVAHFGVAQRSGRLAIFAARGSGWLTAPIRNETPGFPRLTGTKTPVFGAGLKRITKHPYLKQYLKTIQNRVGIQSPAEHS